MMGMMRTSERVRGGETRKGETLMMVICGTRELPNLHVVARCRATIGHEDETTSIALQREIER
jgi:hypothetical protein